MEQISNTNCQKTPINLPAQTKMLILSPDILNKLGIASQITNLTRLATENSNNKNIEEKNVLQAKNVLENEIKLRLSQTLNKSFDRREDLNKINNIEQSSNISLATKNSNISCENVTIITKTNPPKNKIKINEIKIIKRGNYFPNKPTIKPDANSSTESLHLYITPTVNNIDSIGPKNIQGDIIPTKYLNNSTDLNNINNIKRSKRIEIKKVSEAHKSNTEVSELIANVSTNVSSITVDKVEEFNPFVIKKPTKTYSRRKPSHNTEIEDEKEAVNIVNINNESQKVCTEKSVEILSENESLLKTYSRIKYINKLPTIISSQQNDYLKQDSSDIIPENKNPLVISFTEQPFNNFDENSLADIPIIFEDQLMNYAGTTSLISLEDSDISLEDCNINVITIPSCEREIKKMEVGENVMEGLTTKRALIKENVEVIQKGDEINKSKLVEMNKKVEKFEHNTEIMLSETDTNLVDKRQVENECKEDTDDAFQNVSNVVDEEINKRSQNLQKANVLDKSKEIEIKKNIDIQLYEKVEAMPKESENKNEDVLDEEKSQKSKEETLSNIKNKENERDETNLEIDKSSMLTNQAINNIEIVKDLELLVDEENTEETLVKEKEPRREEFILPEKRAELQDSDNDLREEIIRGVGPENKEKEIVKTTSEERKADGDNYFVIPEEEISVKKASVKLSKMNPECAIKIKEELKSSREDITIPVEEVEVTPSPGTPTPRKRGRPSKNKGKIIESNTVVPPVDPLAITPTPVRKRGRPSKNPSSKPLILHHEIFIKDEDTSSEPTASNSRGRKRKNAIEIENGFKVVKCSMVECGVCKEVINNTQWTHHLIKHNYLAWRVGEDPIDLDDRKAVERALFRAVKERKAVFVCEYCGSKKKSVLGYLGHKEMCQISDEVRQTLQSCEV